MEHLLRIIFGLLIATNAFASAIPAGAPVIGLGAVAASPAVSYIPLSNPAGGTFSTPGAYATFSLFGGAASTLGANDYYPLYKNGSAYKVSSGLNVGAICIDATASSYPGNSTPFQLFSNTTSFIFGATSLTGTHTFQCGADQTYCHWTGQTVNLPAIVPGMFVFPSGNYVGFQAQAASQYAIHLDCYEY